MTSSLPIQVCSTPSGPGVCQQSNAHCGSGRYVSGFCSTVVINGPPVVLRKKEPFLRLNESSFAHPFLCLFVFFRIFLFVFFQIECCLDGPSPTLSTEASKAYCLPNRATCKPFGGDLSFDPLFIDSEFEASYM